MAIVLADRVKELTTTEGLGDIVLDGSPISFQTFSGGIGAGNQTYYTVVDNTSGDWEVILGTVMNSPSRLTIDTVLSSSNGGSQIDLQSGEKDVFVTIPAVLFQFT